MTYEFNFLALFDNGGAHPGVGGHGHGGLRSQKTHFFGNFALPNERFLNFVIPPPPPGKKH